MAGALSEENDPPLFVVIADGSYFDKSRASSSGDEASLRPFEVSPALALSCEDSNKILSALFALWPSVAIGQAPEAL